MGKKVILSPQALPPVGPYSQAIEADGTIYCSGFTALDFGANAKEIVFSIKDIEGQTRRVMTNLQHVLESAGVTFDHVVKTTIYLSDFGNFVKVNEVYGSYFKSAPPARTTIGALLPPGCLIEIEMIARRFTS